MKKTKIRQLFKQKTIIRSGIITTLCVLAVEGLYQAYQKSHLPLEVETKNVPLQKSNLRIAPGFDLPDASGKRNRLEDFRGSLILIHFWASWCPPCLEEIPQWVELATRFKTKKVKFITISLDQNWPDVHKIFPSIQISGQISGQVSENILSLLDISGTVPDQYGTYQFPETYLLNPEFKILFKWVGPQNWNSLEVDRLLDQLRPKS